MQAVLCGYYGMGNGGDEALLATLLQMLPEEVTPLVLSGNPDQTRDRYGVRAVDRKNFFQVWQALRQSQVFIFGGGSLIQDVTSAVSPIYYTGLMAIAQFMGLRTIAWAQGIGPILRAPNRWIAHYIFKRCDQVSVRDRASAALLDDWGVRYLLAPDPVWAMASYPSAIATAAATAVRAAASAELRSGHPDTPGHPIIAVNLRRHPQLTPERLELITQALVAFQQITSAVVWLVPFQASQDLAIAQQLQPQIPASVIVEESDPQRLKGLFQIPKMAIAMRLHGVIMAAAEGCNCFALCYDPKVTQLIQATAIAGVELEALPDTPDALAQLWLSQYQRGAESALSDPQISSREGLEPGLAPGTVESETAIPVRLHSGKLEHQPQKGAVFPADQRQRVIQAAQAHREVLDQGIKG